MELLYFFVILLTLDASVPVLAKTYGIGEFPSSRIEYSIYRRKIGYFKWPRSIVLIAASVSLWLIVLPGVEMWGLILSPVLLVAWVSLLARDIYVARKEWVSRGRP